VTCCSYVNTSQVFKIASAFFHGSDCQRVKWRFLISNVSAGNVRVTCVTGNTLSSSYGLSGAERACGRNDYVTIVGCWQELIKAANNPIQTKRCSGRNRQASRYSGRTSNRLAVFRSNLNEASSVPVESIRLAGVPVESVKLVDIPMEPQPS